MTAVIRQLVHYLVLALCGLTLCILTSEVAKAALVFTLERQTDNIVKVNIGGNLQVGTDFFSLDSALSEDGGPGADRYATGIVVGGVTSYYYYAQTDAPNFRIESNSQPFQAGEATGYIVATLNEAFANIGASGLAYSAEGNEIGKWSIIAPVPLPAALPLLASSLIGLGWLQRRLRSGLRDNLKKINNCL